MDRSGDWSCKIYQRGFSPRQFHLLLHGDGTLADTTISWKGVGCERGVASSFVWPLVDH